MHKVLDKDIIENEVLPHLSIAKWGFKTKSCLVEIVNCILYKLKKQVFDAVYYLEKIYLVKPLSCKTVSKCRPGSVYFQNLQDQVKTKTKIRQMRTSACFGLFI
jgi:hypothetical protein